jgi:hypothetical protein
MLKTLTTPLRFGSPAYRRFGTFWFPFNELPPAELDSRGAICGLIETFWFPSIRQTYVLVPPHLQKCTKLRVFDIATYVLVPFHGSKFCPLTFWFPRIPAFQYVLVPPQTALLVRFGSPAYPTVSLTARTVQNITLFFTRFLSL